ncbi:hypothetical protein A6A07_31340 [Streptomyces sp. CB03911]|nr:hypothetical protein A6A07_31340 [Streptomyces sp. CB03911]
MGHPKLAGPRRGGAGWAARITADGVLALQYRRRRNQPAPTPHPVGTADPALHALELLNAEMDPLRRFLAIPDAGGARPAAAGSRPRRPCPTARFYPREPARDLGHWAPEYRLPAGRVCAVVHGHRLIFVCPHNSR